MALSKTLIRFRTTSSEFKSPRRRAEEYLRAPSPSQSSYPSGLSPPSVSEPRAKPTPKSGASGASGAGTAGGARTWQRHQGLARQKAEVEASVQDYRRLLLKSLKTLSKVRDPRQSEKRGEERRHFQS